MGLLCLFQTPRLKVKAESLKRWVVEGWPGGRGHGRWGYGTYIGIARHCWHLGAERLRLKTKTQGTKGTSAVRI